MYESPLYVNTLAMGQAKDKARRRTNPLNYIGRYSNEYSVAYSVHEYFNAVGNKNIHE